MPQPLVAIVGRPNVGKSSLLNRFAGRRVSIVEPTAGVTRDRIVIPVEHRDRRFEVMDTGGLGLVDEERLKDHIEAQIQVALDACDAVLFVVDGKEGAVPGDELVARRLRRLGHPVVLVVNKTESYAEEQLVGSWERLGFGEPVACSALEGFGISVILDRLLEFLPEDQEPEEHRDADLRFAVVGKRNSGKSTLINQLAGEERVIVSEIPGTTRDSVDVVFDDGDRRLVAIDTAGLRKKSSIEDAIEMFSHARARASIKRADVVLHLFDVREPISQVDKKLAHEYARLHKPVLIVGNKIDLADTIDLEKWDAYIRQQLALLHFAPVAFISAKEGQNVRDMVQVLFDLMEQSGTRIGTGDLNRSLQEAKTKLSPKSRGKMPKLYFGTQTAVHPPTFVIFVNDPSLFRGNYERYLANHLRSRFGLEEIPLRVVFRERSRARPGDAKGAPARPS